MASARSSPAVPAAAPPDGITAFMVGMRSKVMIFTMQRAINDYRQEALLAIIPGVALTQLWDLVAVADTALMVVAAFVVLAGLLGMLTAILTSLNERRREMAILRSVGARPGHVATLLVAEAAMLALAGVALGLEGTGVRVIGIESEASPSMSTALAAGSIVPIEVEPTVADGLAGNLEPGAVTVGVALSHGVEVLTVSEADIRSAMAFSASKMGLVLEGAGAVGVAALRAGVVTPDPDGRQTVVLLTGRNVAPKLLSEVLHS